MDQGASLLCTPDIAPQPAGPLRSDHSVSLHTRYKRRWQLYTELASVKRSAQASAATVHFADGANASQSGRKLAPPIFLLKTGRSQRTGDLQTSHESVLVCSQRAALLGRTGDHSLRPSRDDHAKAIDDPVAPRTELLLRALKPRQCSAAGLDPVSRHNGLRENRFARRID